MKNIIMPRRTIYAILIGVMIGCFLAHVLVTRWDKIKEIISGL